MKTLFQALNITTRREMLLLLDGQSLLLQLHKKNPCNQGENNAESLTISPIQGGVENTVNNNNDNFIASIAHNTWEDALVRFTMTKNYNSTIYNQISYMKNGKI